MLSWSIYVTRTSAVVSEPVKCKHTELLRSISLFSELSEDEVNSIHGVARARSYKAKEMVVQQTDPGGDMFVIVSGHLKVVSSDPEGRDTALGIMAPGEIFGEVSLLDGSPRSATIIALEPCELLIIERSAFLRLLETMPSISIKLLGVLAQRLRRLTERAEDIAFLNVSKRLAKAIVKLADEYGQAHGDAVRVSFRLSQQEMGDLVGATRESANKHIRIWEQAGLVAQESGRLIILDLEALRKIGGDGMF